MDNIAFFLENLWASLKHHGIAHTQDRILVAVSGGADSMALLHGLSDLQARHGASLAVAHLNHGLRPEADEEESFVAEQADRLGLAFHRHRAFLDRDFRKYGIEEAGRMARYAFFETLCARFGYTRIATAHHADDRVEQILMNLIRGCGPDGLQGIPASRGKQILRPLMGLHRSHILAYLLGKGLTWKEDASNQDTRFLRNRIRHILLPLLEREFNPAIKKTLLRTGDIAEKENLWLSSLVRETFASLLIYEAPGTRHLDAPGLSGFPPGLQARVLRHAIQELTGNTQAITQTHIEAITTLLNQKESRQCHLPGKLLVRLSAGILEILRSPHALRHKEDPVPTFRQLLLLPECLPQEIPLPPGLGRLRISADPPPSLAPGIHQAIPPSCFPLILRALIPGDRMRPAGRGGSRKIFPLLSEAKVPLHLRAMRPVVAREKEILWVPGLPPDASLSPLSSSEEPLWLSWRSENG
ncbi:tRNA lysidine(34) synthetase TilS [Desulfobotulus sp.]|uniref:tRNA lysidine(34) synthetase TilS n=1 Tax=Desulfobotulus sp. TaxID=1940337 RepID=UPI002A35C750|nr:tRNA lysidine(34) synthetase TilS [Desulfobotulus sp.]MDY0162598.1 tRNA lysidine(34) synthetase TilS [Desulfobotulus sp.]